MNPKVTIIVPIYNTSLLLPRCLDSLKRQTFSDIEILLIDDGSTDDSQYVCERYCEKDSRFKYWYKQNGGLSSARNFGIQLATGEYISYVDSDDYISENTYEIAYEKASHYGVDLLNFGYTYFDAKENAEKRTSILPKNQVFDKQVILDLLKKDPLKNKLLWFSCFYLFRTQYVNKNKLFFDESVLLGEDSDYNLRSLLSAEKIYSIDDNLYYYVFNANSLTQHRYKEGLLEKFSSQFKARVKVYKDYGIFEKDYIVEISRNYLEHSLFELISNEYINHPNKKALDNIKKIRRDPMFVFCCKHYKHSKKCTRNKKILISLFVLKLFYPLHFLLKKIK